MTADLVVDATGRESKAPEWLKSLGYIPPPETIVNPFLGYASQLYTLPPDPRRDWKGMIILANPPEHLRNGLIWPTEDGHWMVLLGGSGRDYPPNDTDAFLQFSKGLSDPSWFEAVKEAQPLSPIYSSRKTENRLRHFERLRRQPERFLVIGDAVCALNPVYAQGMTVAALGAMELRECLRQCGPGDLSGLARRFQHKLARVNAFPWRSAVAVDMRVPGVEGESVKWTAKITSYYLKRLGQQAITDSLLSSLFFQVMQMVEPPTALFKPSIVMRVLLNTRRNNVFSQEKS
jgi:flavin-dependent dehydrogenase